MALRLKLTGILLSVALVIAVGTCARMTSGIQAALPTAARALEQIDRSKTKPVSAKTLVLNSLRITAGLRQVTDTWKTADCKMKICDGPAIEILIDENGAEAKVILRDCNMMLLPSYARITEYEVAHGALNGKAATWIGQPLALLTTETYAINRLNGETVYYQTNGTPICACEFKDDKPWTGRMLQRNGFAEITWDVSYLDGKLDGEERQLQADGLPTRIRRFKAGVPDGLQESYHEGKLRFQEWLVHGVKSAEKSFYPGGAAEFETHYDEKGRLHGKRIKRSESGELEIEENYKNGKLHGLSWEKGHPEGWYWEGKGCGGKAGYEKRQAKRE